MSEKCQKLKRGATGYIPYPPEELERPTGFEPATSSLGSWHSATELRPPGVAYSTTDRPPLLPVLERHVVGLDELVAARLPVETLGRAVEVELLVERDRGGVLDPQLVDLVVLGQPLLLVHDRLRLVEEAIELGIAVAGEVRACPEERSVDRLGIECGRAPPDQPDRS